MTNDVNKPVWQWPYSAFGTTKPTGILKATVKPKNAMTNQPVLLKGTVPPQRFDLRYPGQMEDAETGTNQNYMRSYWPMHGAFNQFDPTGLDGGLDKRGYAGGNPLIYADPMGLQHDARPTRPNRPGWWNDITRPIDTSNCATAECAAGMPAANSENRTQSEIAVGQCKLICSIVGPDNLIPGGKTVRKLLEFAGAKVAVNLSCDAICEDPDKRKAFCGL